MMTLFSESDLRPTRRAMREMVERLPFDAKQVAEITLAVAEACANGVRHGHGETEAPIVTVQAASRDDHLEIEVTDCGHGFHLSPPAMPNPYAESGRGIAMMYALMDHVAIESTHTGTRVCMVKYFRR